MNFNDAADRLESLLSDTPPSLKDPAVREALSTAARLLRGERAIPVRANVGKSWRVEDDRLLSDGFDSGKSIEQLARELKRSALSVRGRLMKLGKVISDEFSTEY